VRICLHHSSVPYVAAPAPVTEAEVLEAQELWANSIASISKVRVRPKVRVTVRVTVRARVSPLRAYYTRELAL